jgi:phosphopantothenoylcysteine decarboxylase/phosphopantothenate--cysteine ligase
VSGLVGKKILLGVAGGIAAYKAAELVRLLRNDGAETQVVMTDAGAAFVTPLTFQALSGRPVRRCLFDEQQESAMGHIELARWADLILIAPATADCMARLAHGLADDLLTTLCLASEAPLALAPAMNQAMWRHPATRENARLLTQRGAQLWGPAEGAQACGETGPGRMLEPLHLLEAIRGTLGGGRLAGCRVLVTAGPTREPLDPVRFVGNRSSGKMGYALAAAFVRAGAQVQLISGPVCLDSPRGVARVRVETAEQMLTEVRRQIGATDIFVACAAVADYRPAEPALSKIKKTAQRLDITMLRNPDILSEVAARRPRPFCVGFAAETERPVDRAEAKRRAKGLDMIAANLVGAEQGGFESEENALMLIWDGGFLDLPMRPKAELAAAVVEAVADRYHAARPAPGDDR